MFGKNKELILDNERLKQRIEQLEFIICKGKHEFLRGDEYYSYGGSGNGDERFEYEYTCKNCGKIIFKE